MYICFQTPLCNVLDINYPKLYLPLKLLNFLDESVIPSFEQLQRGLLNDPEHVGALVRLTMALLHQCLCDPGVPAHGPWVSVFINLVAILNLDTVTLLSL